MIQEYNCAQRHLYFIHNQYTHYFY